MTALRATRNVRDYKENVRDCATCYKVRDCAAALQGMFVTALRALLRYKGMFVTALRATYKECS